MQHFKPLLLFGLGNKVRIYNQIWAKRPKILLYFFLSVNFIRVFIFIHVLLLLAFLLFCPIQMAFFSPSLQMDQWEREEEIREMYFQAHYKTFIKLHPPLIFPKCRPATTPPTLCSTNKLVPAFIQCSVG